MGDNAYFCPRCSSAAVDVPALVGATASCRSCSWTGTTQQLLVHQFKHDLGSDQQVITAFMSDFKQLMASTIASPLAKILMKWGFFEKELPTPVELGRYIKVMAEASVKALLEERQNMEKERVLRGN